MTAPPTRRHIAALDGLRGIAILLVILLHTSGPPAGIAMMPTEFDLGYAHVAAYGWAGVDLFFVLSGFLITGILVATKGSPNYFRNFIARRTLRIFPLYYAVVLVRLFVFPGNGHGFWESASYLGYFSNWWQAANPAAALGNSDVTLGVAWSLAIEEQFYLLWPPVVWLLSMRNLRVLCVAIVIAVPLLRATLLGLDVAWQSVYLTTPCRIDTLVMGALIAILPLPGRALARVFTVAAAAGVAAVVYVEGNATALGFWMQTAGYTCNALLSAGIVLLALQPGIVARVGQIGWLRLFGRHSYAIYLLHTTVQHLLRPFCFGPDAWLPLGALIERTGGYVSGVFPYFLLVATVTLLAGLVTWHAFEKHMLALKRHFA